MRCKEYDQKSYQQLLGYFIKIIDFSVFKPVRISCTQTAKNKVLYNKNSCSSLLNVKFCGTRIFLIFLPNRKIILSSYTTSKQLTN